MNKGFLAAAIALLLVGLSQAATMLTDSGTTVETVTSLDQIDQIVRNTQWQFWKLVPPATDDPFYLHPEHIVRIVDWDSKDWPKPFIKQMYAELGSVGNYGAMYPFYRLSVVEDRSGDMVYYNAYDQEVWRTFAPKDYNPYLFAYLTYGVDTADDLTSMQKIFGRSSNVGTELIMIPVSFASLYEEDAAMDSSAMRLATEPVATTDSLTMLMTTSSIPEPPGGEGTNTNSTASATNIPVTLTFSVPSDFGSSTAEIFECTNLVNVASWDIGVSSLAVTAGTDRVWTDMTSSNIPCRFYILNDPSNDQDSDGLNDGRERYVSRTDPTNRDSDFDGLGDGFEVLVQGSDPHNMDSDGDGVVDGVDSYPTNAGPQITINTPVENEVVTNNTLTVEGVAIFDGTVQSVLVGAEPATLTQQSSNEWTFSGTIQLDHEGMDTFYVQAEGESGGKTLESEVKRTVTVDALSPELSVLSCANGAVFTNLYVHFTVQTDDPASVSLNGTVMARDGFLNYGWAELSSGTNSVVFDSTDAYGRTTTNTLTVVCNVPDGYTEQAPSDADQDGIIDSEDPAPNDPSIRSAATVTSVVNGETVDLTDVSQDRTITVSGSAPAGSSVTINVGGVMQTVTANASGNYSAIMQLQAGLNAISVSGSGFQTTSYVTAYIPPPRLEFLLTWTSIPSFPISLNIAHSKTLPIVNGEVAPSDPSFAATAVASAGGFVKKLIVNAPAGSYILDMRCGSTPTFIGYQRYNISLGAVDQVSGPSSNQATIRILQNGKLAYYKTQQLQYWGQWQMGEWTANYVFYNYYGGVQPWSIGHFVVHSKTETGGYVVENGQRALAPQMGRMGQTLFSGVENPALSGPNGSSPVYLLPGQAAQFTLAGDMRPSSRDWQNEKINAAFSGPVDKTGVFLASTPGHYQIGILDNLLQSTNGVYYTTNDVPSIDVNVLGVDSETVATVPANRARKTLGVGEEVELSFVPSTLATSVTWSVSGGGSFDSTNGSPVKYTAPINTSSPIITATCHGLSIDVPFAVVEPTGVSAPVVLPVTSNYGVNDAGAGMGFGLWLMPTNVSFYNVKIMEIGMVATNASGYFANTNVWPSRKLDHSLYGANDPRDIFEDNYISGGVDPNGVRYTSDNANSGICPQPWSPGGHFTWPIPGVWWVKNSSVTNTLSWSDQDFYINALGTVEVDKFGHTATRETNNVYTVLQ